MPRFTWNVWGKNLKVVCCKFSLKLKGLNISTWLKCCWLPTAHWDVKPHYWSGRSVWVAEWVALQTSELMVLCSNLTVGGIHLMTVWRFSAQSLSLWPFHHLDMTLPFQQTANCWYFSYFSQKTGFDISCKLSPEETICMKYQILFSGKNKKNISKCRLLKILPRVLSVK